MVPQTYEPESPTSVAVSNNADEKVLHEGDSRPKLLKRLSTFWPTDQELLQRHPSLLQRRPSLELLSPAHDCESRKSSPLIAIFNLVANVCGGGVLSLPLAFSRAGVIPSTLMMIFAAIMTNFAMYILCSCARRTGGRSYGDCARNAFGPLAEIGAIVLLIMLLCFVLVAFMVLVKDIWTPVILSLLPALETFFAHSSKSNDEDVIMNEASDYMLVPILMCTMPFLLKKDLHALRHTCYVGFASALILTAAVVHRAIDLNVFQEPGLFQEKVNWVGDLEGILFAFPIICLSFFCIYNVLSVHSALVNPTRSRVKFVLDGTVMICLVLFYIIGLFGYLYAYDDVCDNILLNFPLSFKTILVGRIGFGITLMFGMPLIVLPCRENILSLPSHIREWRKSRSLQKGEDIAMSNFGNESGHLVINGVNFDEEWPLLKKKTVSFRDDSFGDNAVREGETKVSMDNEDTVTVPEQATSYSTILKPRVATTLNATIHEEDLLRDEDDNNLKHLLSTVVLIAIGYVFAIAVPGVGVVWSIVGSSMALIIGFFIPTACYLKIRSRKRLNPRSVAAWLLLIFSVVASVICTAQAVTNMTS